MSSNILSNTEILWFCGCLDVRGLKSYHMIGGDDTRYHNKVKVNTNDHGQDSIQNILQGAQQ